MKIFKLFIVAFITLVAATSLFADSDDDCPGYGRGGGRGFGSIIYLREELNLTDAQYTKVKAIAEKYAELRYDNRGDRDKMHDLFDEQNEAVKAVLTADQKVKYDSLRKDRKGRGRGRGRGGC